MFQLHRFFDRTGRRAVFLRGYWRLILAQHDPLFSFRLLFPMPFYN